MLHPLSVWLLVAGFFGAGLFNAIGTPAPDAFDALLVHHPAGSAQQRRDPPVAYRPYCRARTMMSSVYAASSHRIRFSRDADCYP